MWKTYYTECHNVVNGGWEPRVIILCPLHLAKNGRSKINEEDAAASSKSTFILYV